jgi:hypothetical protein
MQGRSLVSLLRHPETAWRDVFIYECLDSYGGTKPMLGATTAEWSLIQTWDSPVDVGRAVQPFSELYHRQWDRAEAQNVAADPRHAGIRAKLEREIARHLGQIGVLK